MKSSYLLIVLLLTSCTYTAASTEIQWDRPVERENGEQLFIYEIDHFELSAVCDGNTEQLFLVIGEAETITDDSVGNCKFKILAVDTNGLYSVYSEEMTITIKTPPKSPFNLRIFK
jgi:hypothetical protein